MDKPRPRSPLRKLRPRHAAHLARRFLQRGDAVLEIGAADGEYTRVYADRVGRRGAVLAVEPQRAYHAPLEQLRTTHPWVSLAPVAVGAVVGEAVLHTNRTHPKCSSLYPLNVRVPGEAYAVPVTTVDALVQTLPQTPQLIQVDAQGAEAAILHGAPRTLRLPVVWVLELWPNGLQGAGASLEEIVRAFTDAHYTPHTVREKAVTWATVERAADDLHGWSSCDLLLVPRDLMVAAA